MDHTLILVGQVGLIPATTIGLGNGTDGTGGRVRFAGDHRMMRGIADAIASTGSPVYAHVESWQLLGRASS